MGLEGQWGAVLSAAGREEVSGVRGRGVETGEGGARSVRMSPGPMCKEATCSGGCEKWTLWPLIFKSLDCLQGSTGTHRAGGLWLQMGHMRDTNWAVVSLLLGRWDVNSFLDSSLCHCNYKQLRFLLPCRQ